MAQVVARLTGGQEVASSSLVTPTSNGDVASSPRTEIVRGFFYLYLALVVKLFRIS